MKRTRSDGSAFDHASIKSTSALLHFPAGVKHRIGNSREQTVRLVLFFDRPSHPVSFDEPLMPMEVVVLGE